MTTSLLLPFIATFLMRLCCAVYDVTVKTPLGTVVGNVHTLTIDQERAYHVDTFLGVPFAQPPVGFLRFKPPRPVKPWSTPIEAKTLTRACVQESDSTFGQFWGSTMWNANTPQSEGSCHYRVIINCKIAFI